MKRFKALTYVQQIQWRIRLLWAAVALMLGYMVLVGETGGGDSRVMTGFADAASRVIFFGGLIYIFVCIHRNKRLLRDRQARRAQALERRDERKCYLHDKSGGRVMDILLVALLAITLTAALYDMTAFYTAAAILALAAGLKGAAYCVARWA
ncbi:hypothetical protein H8699_09990 [Christensenellaceae bacterium NSJ-44]|uniref:Uncharacterized protein n=1 Tax=Luoshenia tenuis TaxID=2763654 RepID=A0A926HN25_9FIRM|nr:hypothetical protein [Luoshenia tenuis]MBC8529758.1 hypothetical protein [Luoshenia tenuis]